MGSKGIVASSAAMGVLLQQGIGDTIRISLTPEPNGDRTLEVKVAQELLQTVGLRTFVPLVAACPGCGRTTSTTFQELAFSIQSFIRDSMPEWKTRYPGVEGLNVAVMGCIVNGPGESKHADIGISLPGTGEHADGAGLHRRQEGDDAARPDSRRRFPKDRHRLYRAAIRHRAPAGPRRNNRPIGPIPLRVASERAGSDPPVFKSGRGPEAKWLPNKHSPRESVRRSHQDARHHPAAHSPWR